MPKKIAFIILALVILTSCSKKAEKPAELTIEEVEEVQEETLEEEVEPVKEGKMSPLSGLYFPDEKINRRVVGVMFDNHNKARWQAGLKDAEIIYEYRVEAPYTRYLGLYLANDPEEIGPIRSSRPYFVTKILEYDGVYVRVGGSEAAKKDIKDLKIADIDGLSSSNKVFYRKSHKKMPHNLYSNMDIIRKTQEERGYRLEGDFIGFKFKEAKEEPGLDSAKFIEIDYGGSNTSSYEYDGSKEAYKRFKDGALHIDELDSSSLYADNIILEELSYRTIDNEGRLDVELIGEGKGIYISMGKQVPITWKKETRASRTKYYMDDMTELTLNPGVTWIQMIDRNAKVRIE